MPHITIPYLPKPIVDQKTTPSLGAFGAGTAALNQASLEMNVEHGHFAVIEEIWRVLELSHAACF